eukprot:scaffold25.g5087.t1
MSLLDDYGNYTAAQCFALPAEQQVPCSAQHLNVSDPPSTYSFDSHSVLWEPIQCLLANVTYSTRWNLPNDYNYCAVPNQGQDAFLFVSLALLAAACLFGKLSAVFILVLGGVVFGVNYVVNLRAISNALSLWMGIQPPDIFFYAFLPPLLVDSAIRIDFFMFSKIWVHSLLLAFVMVFITALVLTPIILFVMGFAGRGWSWVNGALFAAIIAPTDALAATAVLKQGGRAGAGGGPEKLVVIMEGEALWNDASAFTLFEVFMHLVEMHADPSTPWPTVWSEIGPIIALTCKLAGIGIAIGWAFSLATGYLLRWLRWRGAKPKAEIVLIIAVAYLSFYVAQVGRDGRVWRVGAVSIVILNNTAWSYAAIPLIYLSMMLIRVGCIFLFNWTVFKWLKEGECRAPGWAGTVLTWQEVLFTGWSGLRGAVSLILIADFVNVSTLRGNPANRGDPFNDVDVVNGDISLWTSAFVFLTLCINAPAIGPVMRLLRLDRIPVEKMQMRAKAKRALSRFTASALDSLRDDDAELLQGANWEAVAQYVDVSDKLPWDDPSAAAAAAAAPAGKGADAAGEEAAAAGVGEGAGAEEAPPPKAAPAAPLPRSSSVPSRLRKVAELVHLPGAGGRAKGKAPLSRRDSVARSSARSGPGSGGSSSDDERSSRTGGALEGSDAWDDECPFLLRVSAGANSAADAPASEAEERDLLDELEAGLSAAGTQAAAAGAAAGAALGGAAAAVGAAAAAAGAAALAGGGAADRVAARAAAGEEESDDGAAALAALKRRQQRPQRPQLGSLFSPAPAPHDAPAGGAERAAPPAPPAGRPPLPPAPPAGRPPQPPAPAPAPLPRPESGASLELGYSSPLPPIQEGIQALEAAPALSAAALEAHAALALALAPAEEEEVGGGGGGEAYYASLPAGVGRARLAAALAAELAAGGGAGGAAPGAEGAGVEGAGADAGPPTREPEVDYYASVPARLGAQYSRRLRGAGHPRRASSRASSAPSSPVSPRPPFASSAAAAAAPAPAAEDETYYSSVPARLGAQYGRELAAALHQQSASSGSAGAPPPAAGDDGGGGEEATYSSVPAAVGARMHALLRRLRAGEGGGSAPITPRGLRASAAGAEAAADAAASRAASLAEDGGEPRACSSMPAALGQRLARQLSAARGGGEAEVPSRLGRRPPLPPLGPGVRPSLSAEDLAAPAGAAAAAAGGSLPSSPRAGGPAAPAPAPAPPRPWEETHHTVSGLTGSALAAELSRQRSAAAAAAAAPPAPPPPARLALPPVSVPRVAKPRTVTPPRDLLGRRLPPQLARLSAGAAGGEAYDGPAAGGARGAPPSARGDLRGHRRMPSLGAAGFTPTFATVTPLSVALVRSRAGTPDTAPAPGGAARHVGRAGGAAQGRGDVSARHRLLRPSRTLPAGMRRGDSAGPASEVELGAAASGPLAVATAAADPGAACLLGRTYSSTVLGGGEAGGAGAAPPPLPPLARGASRPRLHHLSALTQSSGPADASAHSGRSGGPEADGGSLTAWGSGPLTGGGTSDAGPASTVGPRAASAGELAEMRSRLVAGLKRYYHAKRMEGLLSAKGLRILDYACDRAAEEAGEPLQMWGRLESEIKGDRAAIQSYRAAMALLRQALTFVHELYDAGMIDQGEKDVMLGPLDKKMRHLEIVGPVWRPPRPRAVLRSLPFLAPLPQPFFDHLFQQGTISEHKVGTVVWAPDGRPAASGLADGPGAFVVLSGVIRRVVTREGARPKEFFQGTGGVVGSLLAMTGARLPRTTEHAVAVGNTLGKGPLLFHLPQAMVRQVLDWAALATGYVVDGMEASVAEAVAAHMARLAAERSAARRHGQRRAAHEQQQQQQQAQAQAQTPPPQRAGAPVPEAGGPARSRSTVAFHQLPPEVVGGGGGGALQGSGAAAGGGPAPSRSMGAGLARMMAQIAEEEFEGLQQRRPTPIAEASRAAEGADTAGGSADGSAHSAGLWRGSPARLARLSLNSTLGSSPLNSTPGSAPLGGSPLGGAPLGGTPLGGSPLGGTPLGSARLGSARLGSARLGGAPLGGGDAAEAHAAEARAARKARAAARLSPQVVAEVLLDVRAGLPAAAVVELPPGVPHSQTTHEVLLRGELLPAPRRGGGHGGHGGHEGGPAPEGAAAAPLVGEAPAAAPAVLPWLWTRRLRCSLDSRGALEPAIEWRAGEGGALVAVWLTEDGLLPPAVPQAEVAARAAHEAAEAAAAAEAEAEAAAEAARAAEAADALRSHPLGAQRSSRARESALGGMRRLLPWQHPVRQRRPPWA